MIAQGTVEPCTSLLNDGKKMLSMGQAPCEQTLRHVKGVPCAQLPCSLVVVGVGVQPEVELFKGQLPIADNGGIQVDGSLRPCVPA